MSFGRTGATGMVRVYTYDVPRTALRNGHGSNLDLGIEQMRRRVMLWNRLVEIDRAIRAEQEPVIAPYRERGERLPPEARVDLLAIEERYRDEINRACRESGCFWINSQEVKRDWQAARRKGMPQFHRWDGSGRVAVYLGGLPVADAWGDDRRFRLRPGPRERDAVALIRVGSEGRQGRTPVWLALPLRLHRPLPEDARIRWVAAQREVLAGRDRWSVHLCLEREPPCWRTHGGPRAGVIALDLGWRQRPGGMRVATWADDAGHEGEIVLPSWHWEAMQKVSGLGGIRDQLWNQTIAALAAWVRERERVPGWLAESARAWHAWRRKGHLVHLVRQWTENRFAGDEVGFAIAETWLRRDQHLWEWEANLRDQALRRRREYYRVIAADLARRYAGVVVEDFDLSEVARRKPGPDGEPGPAAELVAIARRQRQWAAVHELRRAIVSACTREGVAITVVPAADTTVTCAACGTVDRFDKRALYHRCSGCGQEWDQDVNAARNLLARAGDIAAGVG